MNKTIEIVGNTDDSLYSGLSISTQFDTTSQLNKKQIETIDSLLTKYFPITRLQAYDIETGKIVKGEEKTATIDANIISWLQQNTNRYHNIQTKRSEDKFKFIGYRPA